MERVNESNLQQPATIVDTIKAMREGNLHNFIGSAQMHVMGDLCRISEEKQFFIDKFVELGKVTQAMPGPYGAQDQEDPTVHLHYFKGGADWFIIEKDESPEQIQCFGLADLFNDGGELGYIPICELIENNVELDLHWTPKPLSEVRKSRQS